MLGMYQPNEKYRILSRISNQLIDCDWKKTGYFSENILIYFDRFLIRIYWRYIWFFYSIDWIATVRIKKSFVSLKLFGLFFSLFRCQIYSDKKQMQQKKLRQKNEMYLWSICFRHPQKTDPIAVTYTKAVRDRNLIVQAKSVANLWKNNNKRNQTNNDKLSIRIHKRSWNERTRTKSNNEEEKTK